MIDWSGFVVAAVLASLIPGANQLLGFRNAAQFGVWAAITGLGGRLAALLVMTGAVTLGLGAIMVASDRILLIIKWVGVVYLAWLGVVTIRQSSASGDESPSVVELPAGGVWRLARTEFAVTMSNPKALLLFAALFPQFTTATHADFSRQLGVLGIGYMGVEVACAMVYIVAGSRLGAVGGSGRRRRWVDVGAGLVFLGLAAFLALEHVG